MVRNSFVIALGLVSLFSESTPAQSPVPSGAYVAAFDRADRRSRAFIDAVRCAQAVSSARRAGLFGPADSVGAIGQCIRSPGVAIGVFMDVDTQFVTPTRFAVVDLAKRARRTGPVDTAAVMAVARATREAQVRGADAYERANRPYAPISFRFDGDSIEVWLVPASLLMGHPFSIGGERGYVFTPDGRRLVREVDAFGDYRSVTVPDTGNVRFIGRDRASPALSELVFANGMNDMGRSVSIDWPDGTSVLRGRGASAVWMHAVRKP
jgi:hypothetical protein